MAVSQGPSQDPLRAQSELKNTFNFEHHSFSGMPHPLCVVPLDFSNGIFHFSLSLFLSLSPSCHIHTHEHTHTHTHTAFLHWACLWQKTIIWFQLITGVSPEKAINELWPPPAPPDACLKCESTEGCQLVSTLYGSLLCHKGPNTMFS